MINAYHVGPEGLEGEGTMLNYLDCHKLQHNNVFHGRFIEEV